MSRLHVADIVVIGGGSAGICAAIAAARLGSRVILVERSDQLGGMGTLAMVHTFCGLYHPDTSRPPQIANPGLPAEIERLTRELNRRGAGQDGQGVCPAAAARHLRCDRGKSNVRGEESRGVVSELLAPASPDTRMIPSPSRSACDPSPAAPWSIARPMPSSLVFSERPGSRQIPPPINVRPRSFY